MKLTTTAAGVYAIAPTPFDPDGAVDFASIDRMMDFYIGCGVTGLTILGVMGEAPKLEAKELLEVVHRVLMTGRRAANRGRGVGARVRRDARAGARIDGARAPRA